MEITLFLLVATFFSLTYAYWNGANDCANTMATVVATEALPPKAAVLLGGFMNGLGLVVAGLLGSAVANTIGKGIIQAEFVTEPVVLGGLAGAIAWAWFATRRGIPVSITHSLVGGVMGAGIASSGFAVLASDVLFGKIMLGIILAPIVGFIAGYIILFLLKMFTRSFLKSVRHGLANRFWRRGQILSSSWLSFSHGMNDGQNAVGAIALAAFAGGLTNTISVEAWMIALVAIAIGLGTMFHGWKVIKTTGEKITELEPIDGFGAQISSALVLTIKSLIGMPVSTTHVAVSGIIGVGGAKDLRAVDWSISRHIVMAWIITIPAAAVVGGIMFFIFSVIL